MDNVAISVLLEKAMPMGSRLVVEGRHYEMDEYGGVKTPEMYELKRRTELFYGDRLESISYLNGGRVTIIRQKFAPNWIVLGVKGVCLCRADDPAVIAKFVFGE